MSLDARLVDQAAQRLEAEAFLKEERLTGYALEVRTLSVRDMLG